MKIVLQPIRLNLHLQPTNGAERIVVVRQQQVMVNVGSVLETGGGTAASYTHIQGPASAVWTINHNLGFMPAVRVLSSGGAEVDALELHTSINQVLIYFSSPFAGTARLT